MHRSLFFALAALAACDSGFQAHQDIQSSDVDGTERVTSLGFRTILQGPTDVWDFGRHVALSNGRIVVTERAAGTPCANRLRVYTAAGDTWTDETHDCATPNPFFGDAVAATADELVTGADAFWSSNSFFQADGSLSVDGSTPAFGSAVALPVWNQAVVTDPDAGTSGKAWVFEFGSPWTASAELTHPGIAAGGRLGTTALATTDLIVLTDHWGRPVAFERDGEGWAAIDAPGTRVHAAHGNTLLVEHATGADLHFYQRRNGAWEASGTLVDAKRPYAAWAFDEVAAFAVQAGQGAFSGIIDRYVRVDGQLDASLRLPLAHTGVSLALSGNLLVVGEAVSHGPGSTGQVHLFDWSADRAALVAEMACPSGDDAFEPNDAIEDAVAGANGTYTLTELSRSDFWTWTVAPGATIAVDLAFVQADGDIDLYLRDASSNALAMSLTVNDGEQASWTNRGTEPVEVYVEARLFTQQERCTSYALTTTIEGGTEPEPETCPADVNEPNDALADAREGTWVNVTDPNAIGWEVTGGDVVTQASLEDWFSILVYANEQVDLTLGFSHAQGDLDLSLRDAEGNILTSSMSTTDDEFVSWTNTSDANVTVYARVHWFNGQYSANPCVPYTLGGLLFVPSEPASE